MNHPLRTTALALVASTLCTSSALADWEFAGSLSEARTQLAAAGTGTHLVFAGGRAESGLSATVDIYEAATEQWSTSSLSVARRSMGAAAVGSHVLFAGGFAAGPSDVVDVLDTATGQWSTAQLSIPRYDLAAATIGDLVIFAGGTGQNGPVSTVDIYDSSTESWSTASLSVARGFVAAAVSGDSVLFAGGDVVDIFHAGTQTWSATLPPRPIVFPSMASVAGQVLIGGSGYEFNVYHEASGTWSVLEAPGSYCGGSATSSVNGAVFPGAFSSIGICDSLIYSPALGWRRSRNVSGGGAAASLQGEAWYAGGSDFVFGMTFYSGTVLRFAEEPPNPTCLPTSNSSGGPAILTSTGSSSLAGNDLTLRAWPVPQQPFVFFHGPTSLNIPFGDGRLCVGGPLVRLAPGLPGPAGRARQVLDLPSAGITVPGTRIFQCWFRDPDAGGAGFNTSSSLSVTFTD